MTVNDPAHIESILNRRDDVLPFGYFHPDTDAKLTWNCGYGPKGEIISVFCYDFGTHKDKKIARLANMEQAIHARDELVNAGWMKLVPPEVTVTYADGEKKPLTREQKRYLARTIKKMAKNNPLDDETDS